MLASKLGETRIPWGILMIEAVLVVASVLLALALDSAREARKEAELADRALAEVVAEVAANCAVIDSVADYHAAVIVGARAPEGLRVGLLRNDAWDLAKSTGAAAHLDYAVAARIAEASTLQRDHRTVVQSYLGALFTRILGEHAEAEWHSAGEIGVIRELARLQERLVSAYEALLEAAGSAANGAACAPSDAPD